MKLLSAVEDVYKGYPEVVETVTNMVVRYNTYLNGLLEQKTSNEDLINCLLSLEADHYFTDC